MPVGEGSLGRMFNVLGNPIDNLPAPEGVPRWPIHRAPPAFEEQETTPSILETGIKVIDLIAPLVRGGKVGLYGGAGVGKTVVIQELISQHRPRARRLLRLRRRWRALPRRQRPLARNAVTRACSPRWPWSSAR